MLSLTYTLTDHATPALRAQAAALDPARLAKAAGEAAVKLFREHFVSLGTNKQGWPTTHFWPAAAESTNYQPSSDGITITVGKTGVRQRLLGGPITPKSAKALTIPISPDAYGHTAKDFPDAFLIKTAKGAYLVRHGQGKNAPLDFLFCLRSNVNQPPNPNVLPNEKQISDTILTAVSQTIRSTTR